MVRARLIDTRVFQIVGVGYPLDLRNNALHVRRLAPFAPDLVRCIAERPVSFLGEEPWHIFPHGLHRLVIFKDVGPQLAHLFLSGFGMIDNTPVIAMITWLLCSVLAFFFTIARE